MEINKKSKHGKTSLILSLFFLIPLVNIFTSIGSIIFGIKSLKNKEEDVKAIIGLIIGGLTFSIFLISIFIGVKSFQNLKDQLESGEIFDDEMIQSMTEVYFPLAINSLESHKARYGDYPENIYEIYGGGANYFIMDPFKSFNPDHFKKAFKDPDSINPEDYVLFYKKTEKGYNLFSVGLDLMPFTEDDIHPINMEEMGNIGYEK